MLGEEYKSFSSSLCNLLHSPITSSLLGPNILLNTLFSNTLSFLSSRNVTDQVSHPYKTTGKYKKEINFLKYLNFYMGHHVVTKVQGCVIPSITNIFAYFLVLMHHIPLTKRTHIKEFEYKCSLKVPKRALHTVRFRASSFKLENPVPSLRPSSIFLRRCRRRRKLQDDLKEGRGYTHLKEEALDRTVWRARCGRSFEPVARQTAK